MRQQVDVFPDKREKVEKFTFHGPALQGLLEFILLSFAALSSGT